MNKRHAFTLLEVMMAFLLTTILLSTLFRWYKQGAVAHVEKRKEKTIVYAEEKMHLRLTQILDGLSKKDISFSSHSLAFEYDNGAEKEASFCGPLDAFLYFKEHQLCLASWPKKDKGKGRKEVLLDSISSVSFEFFDPKGKKWQAEWKEKESCPPMIKLHVDNETFVYFL